jgi:hypothetical protein
MKPPYWYRREEPSGTVFYLMRDYEITGMGSYSIGYVKRSPIKPGKLWMAKKWTLPIEFFDTYEEARDWMQALAILEPPK